MFDRKKQLRWASLKVGIVITLTLLIIFIVIIFSGGIQSLLTKRVLLDIYITDVKGLRKGSAVRVAGVDVGEVRDIKLSKEYGTIVKVSIDKDVTEFLKTDAKATVQTLGLLGDKYIELIPGQAEEKLQISKGIYGYPQIEVREIVGVATSMLNKLERFISKIDEFASKLEKSEGTVSKLLFDPSLYNNLNSTVYELRETIKEFRQGSIGMLAKDKELYERLSKSAKNFEEISNKMVSSDGTLGKMINDPSLYDNLLSSSKKLEALLDEIQKSEGTLQLLLKDKNTAEDLRQSVREIRELIEEIKKNPKKFFKFSVF